MLSSLTGVVLARVCVWLAKVPGLPHILQTVRSLSVSLLFIMTYNCRSSLILSLYVNEKKFVSSEGDAMLLFFVHHRACIR